MRLKKHNLTDNNSNYVHALQDQLTKFESILQTLEILPQIQDFDELLRMVTTKISGFFKADIVSIILLNPHTQETAKTVFREGTPIKEKQLHLVQSNVVGWMIKFKRPFFSEDLRTDSRFKTKILKKTSIASVASTPIKYRDSVLGFLLLFKLEETNYFSDSDLHFLVKFSSMIAPYLNDASKVEKYFSCNITEDILLNKYQSLGLYGKSKAFIELLKSIEAAARCDVRVLLEGESGTGKELIAKAIHKMSDRASGPFVVVDCGAIPTHLLESELFGHAKGAFTGANTDRNGLVTEANGGTLFLDEINNLDLNLQSKFLRLLQEGEIRPVGRNLAQKVDVRIIAASSISLADLMNEHKFREDLFYRLHVYPIKIPNLEDRKEDIPYIANHFLKMYSQKQDKNVKRFERRLLDFMKHRLWPGNIRELENFVERMVTLTPADREEINIDLLPQEYADQFKTLSQNIQTNYLQKSLQENLNELEEKILRQVLEQFNWNLTQAARALKISKSNIRYRMQKLNIEKHVN